MEKKFKIKLPAPPNFLTYEAPKGYPSQNQLQQNVIPITALTKEEAESFAEEIKQQFLDHWKRLTGE